MTVRQLRFIAACQMLIGIRVNDLLVTRIEASDICPSARHWWGTDIMLMLDESDLAPCPLCRGAHLLAPAIYWSSREFPSPTIERLETKHGIRYILQSNDGRASFYYLRLKDDDQWLKLERAFSQIGELAA